MHKASTWTTARYHLAALGRLLLIVLGDMKIACQDWWHRNIAAPDPTELWKDAPKRDVTPPLHRRTW